MQLNLHLTFAGQCEAAFRFYERVLGATDLRLFTYGDSAMAAEVPAHWRAKIVHASLTVGDRELMGADAQPERYLAPQGFFTFLACSNASEANRVFQALAEGGTIQMPLQQTFWSPCFGVLTDQFGIPWEITCAPANPMKYPPLVG